MPDSIDASDFFVYYKDDETKDVTHDFIEERTFNGKIVHEHVSFGIMNQYMNFTDYAYDKITPLINIFFRPSRKVRDRIELLRKKYNLDMENTLSVYYRGTDKQTETKNWERSDV